MRKDSLQTLLTLCMGWLGFFLNFSGNIGTELYSANCSKHCVYV